MNEMDHDVRTQIADQRWFVKSDGTHASAAPERFAFVAAAAGHLGLWPALYTIAALCFFLQLAGLWRSDEPWRSDLLAVGLTAGGVYLLDRVKIRRAWIDPADQASRPQRYAFLLRHEFGYRLLAIGLLIVAAVVGWRVSFWAPLVVLAGAVSIVIYAAGPRNMTPRMKDLLLVKNLYTAVGLVGFVAIAGWAAAYDASATWAWKQLEVHLAAYATTGILIVRVCLDCALCDVSDEASDRAGRTATAATRMGGDSARHAALVGQILLAVLLLMMTSIPLRPRVWWAAVMVGGSVVSEFVPTQRLADFTDLRFAIEAILAAIGLWLL